MGCIILSTSREGYSPRQIEGTMTVGELIEALSWFDEDMPVMFGNDRQGNGWYTYGRITKNRLHELDADDD